MFLSAGYNHKTKWIIELKFYISSLYSTENIWPSVYILDW